MLRPKRGDATPVARPLPTPWYLAQYRTSKAWYLGSAHPAPPNGRRIDRRQRAYVRPPSQQTVIGQAAVKNVDSQRWQISTHDIKEFLLRRGWRHEPAVPNCNSPAIVELDCVWVVDSFKTYIDVADKRQRLAVRRQTVKKISEFAEEAGGYSGRAI